MEKELELREKVEKILEQVLMAHHDDISQQDDYQISIATDQLLALFPRPVSQEKLKKFIQDRMGGVLPKNREWMIDRLAEDITSLYQAPKEEKYCECKKPLRCNHDTGIIGTSEGIGECNICHKCHKFIDPNFRATKPLPQPEQIEEVIISAISKWNNYKAIELLKLQDKINELVRAINQIR